MSELRPNEIEVVDRAIALHSGEVGALLPIFHAVQDALGFVPDAALPKIAHALNLSRAEVHGTLSFYHDFRTSPPGRHVLKVCRAEACQSCGGEAIAAHLERRLGCRFGETAADGSVTLEPVYCLGNCAAAPSLLLDGELRGRLTLARLDRLVDGLAKEAT